MFQGSDLDEIIMEMFTHMKAHVKNSALVNKGLCLIEAYFLISTFIS